MSNLIKSLLWLSGAVLAAVVAVECTSDPVTAAPAVAPTAKPYADTRWISRRVEFVLTTPDSDEEVRMNFPTGTKDQKIEFLSDGEHFNMEFADEDYLGKYEVLGEQRFLSLQPNTKPSLNLEIDHSCQEEKLVLQMSKNESKEFFATLVLTSTPMLPPDMIRFLNEGQVRMRFEFTRKS